MLRSRGRSCYFFRRLRWKALLGSAFTLLLTAPHAVAMVTIHGQAGHARGALAGPHVWFSTINLLFNPRVTPILLSVAAAGGLVLLARRRWLAALLAVLVLAGISWLHLLVNASFSDAVRYQSATLVLVTPAAAYAVARLLNRRRWLGATAFVALLATAAPGLWLVSRPDLEAIEQDFIRRAMPRLPRNARLVLANERMAARKLLTDFPDYQLVEHGRRWQVVRVDELRRRVRGPLVFYQGLTCASFSGDEVRRAQTPSLRRACARIRRRYRLRPIIEEDHAVRRPRWSSRPYYFHRIPGDTVRLGFYHLER